MLGVTSIQSRREWLLHATNTGIVSGLMGHLARMQTNLSKMVTGFNSSASKDKRHDSLKDSFEKVIKRCRIFDVGIFRKSKGGGGGWFSS